MTWIPSTTRWPGPEVPEAVRGAVIRGLLITLAAQLDEYDEHEDEYGYDEYEDE